MTIEERPGMQTRDVTLVIDRGGAGVNYQMLVNNVVVWGWYPVFDGPTPPDEARVIEEIFNAAGLT